MQIASSIAINKPKDAVWAVITDIEHSSEWISSILSLEVLDKPENGLVGFKWKETRLFCGSEATEVMWITEAVDNDHYCTRAESHGSVYISRISLEESDGTTTLIMSFSAEPQTLLAKLLSALMSRFITKSIKNELIKDLNDIRDHIEGTRQH